MVAHKVKLPAFLVIILISCLAAPGLAQEKITIKDSVIYRRIYRDTIIYRYDTIRINYTIQVDTIRNSVALNDNTKKKGYNPNNWGIGPSVGAYYSPFNGFDVNVGFGVQYYLFAVPSFRKPHTRHKKHGK